MFTVQGELDLPVGGTFDFEHGHVRGSLYKSLYWIINLCAMVENVKFSAGLLP